MSGAYSVEGEYIEYTGSDLGSTCYWVKDGYNSGTEQQSVNRLLSGWNPYDVVNQRQTFDFQKGVFPYHSTPKKLTDTAGYHAFQCKRILDRSMEKHQVEREIALDRNIAEYDSAVVYRSLEYYCLQQGIKPPVLNMMSFLIRIKHFIKGYRANILRLTDSKWWAKKMATKRRRDGELKRIQAGKVTQYCSDTCLDNYERRLAAGKEHMEGMQAISEYGEVMDMANIIKSTIANPDIRKAELSVRNYGFVEYAEKLGHKAAFYTITAPSKYHANSPKYNGSSPRTTQKYLTKQWARIRAELERKGLKIYGFRFVEPHGDATPHWHMVLFMKDEKERKKVTEVIRAYALKEDIAELKVKGYKHVVAMQTIENQVNTLEARFNDLGSRVRLFKRDFDHLKADAISIISAIKPLTKAIKQRAIKQDLKGLIAWLDVFIVEVEWLIEHKKELNEYLFPLDNAGDELYAFITAFYQVKTAISKRFDKWLRVFDKNDPLTGKKTFKTKDRVRFDVEYVEDAGAIVAYIMKYISKNINGDKVGEDAEIGGDAKDTAKRVVAWASLWGIRQFQQVGGSSVTVYRELRRVDLFEDAILEAMRVVADKGSWSEYMELQGGALCPRNKQAVKPYYDSFIDAFTKQESSTAYGEIKQKMLGLFGAGMGNDIVMTRDTQWKLEPKTVAEFLANNTITVEQLIKPITPLPMVVVGENVVTSADAVVFREHSEPWLSVNNCTEQAIRNTDDEVFVQGGMIFDDDGRDLDDIDLYDLCIGGNSDG